MTTYVEPANARLGDVVQDMVGFAVVTGEIVGIDTQGPAILVRWHDVQKRAMDVYSVDSPVWSCFGIVRGPGFLPPALKCESCGQKNLNEAEYARVHIEGNLVTSVTPLAAPGSAFNVLPPESLADVFNEHTPLNAFKLPWGE